MQLTFLPLYISIGFIPVIFFACAWWSNRQQQQQVASSGKQQAKTSKQSPLASSAGKEPTYLPRWADDDNLALHRAPGARRGAYDVRVVGDKFDMFEDIELQDLPTTAAQGENNKQVPTLSSPAVNQTEIITPAKPLPTMLRSGNSRLEETRTRNKAALRRTLTKEGDIKINTPYWTENFSYPYGQPSYTSTTLSKPWWQVPDDIKGKQHADAAPRFRLGAATTPGPGIIGEQSVFSPTPQRASEVTVPRSGHGTGTGTGTSSAPS